MCARGCSGAVVLTKAVDLLCRNCAYPMGSPLSVQYGRGCPNRSCQASSGATLCVAVLCSLYASTGRESNCLVAVGRGLHFAGPQVAGPRGERFMLCPTPQKRCRKDRSGRNTSSAFARLLSGHGGRTPAALRASGLQWKRRGPGGWEACVLRVRRRRAQRNPRLFWCMSAIQNWLRQQ